MKEVIFFDTSVSSANMADHYLTNVCYDELIRMFPELFPYKVSTHNMLDFFSLGRVNKCAHGFILGSGILSPNDPFQLSQRQWRLQRENIDQLPKIHGFGIGFENWTHCFTDEAIEFYKKIFGNTVVGVRGEYTAETLASIGVEAINIGCPTFWRTDYKYVKTTKSQNAIVSVNVYRGEHVNSWLIDTCKSEYETVYGYCQHPDDERILKQYGITDFVVPSFELLAIFAHNNKCDFVGTRIHSASYMLSKGIRSIVVPVDARGVEVWRDIMLPSAEDQKSLNKLINSKLDYTIVDIPFNNISMWSNEVRSRML